MSVSREVWARRSTTPTQVVGRPWRAETKSTAARKRFTIRRLGHATEVTKDAQATSAGISMASFGSPMVGPFKGETGTELR